MRIDFQSDGEVTIIRLEGRFAAGSDAEYIRAKEELSRASRRKVIVDCRDVPYLDSTALNFVVGLYTTVKGAGGRFALCGLNTRMREVLRITHLDTVMPVYVDREAALQALEGGKDKEQAQG